MENETNVRQEARLKADVGPPHQDLRYGRAVDKSRGNWNLTYGPCRTCKHRDAPGNRLPCTACWNPPGDMYEPRQPNDGFSRSEPKASESAGNHS